MGELRKIPETGEWEMLKKRILAALACLCLAAGAAEPGVRDAAAYLSISGGNLRKSQINSLFSIP